MFQLFKDPNTSQYVQSTSGWYHSCLMSYTPGPQGLSKTLVNATHPQIIHHIAHFQWKSLGSDRRWYFSQTPHFTKFRVCIIKWKSRKLGCSTWHFYSCVWHILAVLNTILTFSPLPLAGTFSKLDLTHHTIFTLCIRQVSLELPCKTDVFVHSKGVNISAPGSCIVVINKERNIVLSRLNYQKPLCHVLVLQHQYQL